MSDEQQIRDNEPVVRVKQLREKAPVVWPSRDYLQGRVDAIEHIVAELVKRVEALERKESK